MRVTFVHTTRTTRQTSAKIWYDETHVLCSQGSHSLTAKKNLQPGIRLSDCKKKNCSQGSPSLTAKKKFAVRVPPTWLQKKKRLICSVVFNITSISCLNILPQYPASILCLNTLPQYHLPDCKKNFAVRDGDPWLQKKKKIQSGCFLPDCQILITKYKMQLTRGLVILKSLSLSRSLELVAKSQRIVVRNHSLAYNTMFHEKNVTGRLRGTDYSFISRVNNNEMLLRLGYIISILSAVGFIKFTPLFKV